MSSELGCRRGRGTIGGVHGGFHEVGYLGMLVKVSAGVAHDMVGALTAVVLVLAVEDVKSTNCLKKGTDSAMGCVG